MRKQLSFAVAAVAMLLSSNEASAGGAARSGLEGLVGRPILADGLGAIGLVQAIAPLGADPKGNCRYLMNWASPYNPNLVTLCALSQVTSVLNPGCFPGGPDLPSGILAGGAVSLCEGFDLLGFPVPVTIVATSTGSNLLGVICYDGFFSLPITAGV